MRVRRSPLSNAIIKARGLRTRREFAAEIGATENTIYNWETGRTVPRDIAHIAALVYAAGLTRDDFQQALLDGTYGPQLQALAQNGLGQSRKTKRNSLLPAMVPATLLLDEWIPAGPLIASLVN